MNRINSLKHMQHFNKQNCKKLMKRKKKERNKYSVQNF